MYFPNIQNFARAIKSYKFKWRNSLELIQLIPMVLFSNKNTICNERRMSGGRRTDPEDEDDKKRDLEDSDGD